MAAQKPRMCVAFLGLNWIRELFNGPAPVDLRVICDLRMRGTLRAALVAGGAPENDRLRHLPETEMHAKVYLSEAGAVVCSANASVSALSSATRIEDGVWIGPGTEVYLQVKNEFEARYKKAKPIDKIALEDAPERLTEAGHQAKLAAGFTLVAALRQDPDIFRGIRFVCSTYTVDKDIREAADERLDNETNVGVEPEDKRSRDHFSNWGEKVGDWPALFFSVHRGKAGGFSLTKHRHYRFLSGVNGGPAKRSEDVFVSHKVRWDTAGAAFGDLPRLANHARCKNELKFIFSKAGAFKDFAGRILTGRQFAELLFRNL